MAGSHVEVVNCAMLARAHMNKLAAEKAALVNTVRKLNIV